MSSGVVSLRTRMSFALLVLVELLDRFVGGEDDLSDRRARRGRQAGREHFDVLALLVETGDQEVVELVGLDAEDGFFLA